MNAHQRRIHRRALPPVTGCGRQGHSGTTIYPDLMCTDGYMSDMDADGDDPSAARPPCQHCNPVEHAEWAREQQDEDDELPYGLRPDSKGRLMYECRHCGGDREWCGEPHEFCNDTHMNCGGSPYCLP
jgi:hypothetical protein